MYDTVKRNPPPPDPSGLPISIQTGRVKIQGGDIDAIAAVTLADALIGWEDTHRRAQLNLSNIADTRDLSTCLAQSDGFVDTRRTILGSLTYEF